jgi:hypothetical protein
MKIDKYTLRGLNIQKEEAIDTAVLEAIPFDYSDSATEVVYETDAEVNKTMRGNKVYLLDRLLAIPVTIYFWWYEWRQKTRTRRKKEVE